MKKLGCAKCGGTKKMQDGGPAGNTSPKLERLTNRLTKKTGAGKTISKGLTKRYDKAVDKVIVSGMKKMQEGGIPPPPSRMQYIEAEKLKNKKPYYTKDNIYTGDPKKKKEIDAMIERKTKANTKGMDFQGKKKYATGGPINKPMTYAKEQRGNTNQGMGIFGAPQIGQGAMDGKTGQMKKGGSITKTVKTSCKNTKVRSALGSCVKERPKMAKGGSTKSFPDLNKDKKITKADILMAKGVIPRTKRK